MKTGAPIKYPAPDPSKITLKYDFVFTKHGEWFYINSFNDPNARLVNKQTEPIVAQKEHWVILDPRTGRIRRASSRVARAKFKLEIFGGPYS